MKPIRISLVLAAILATMASMHFIDKEVALGIWQRTSTQPFLHQHFGTIPNTLPPLVAIATTVMWLAYFVISRKNDRIIQTQFIRLAACAVPAAYLIKNFLQHAFGHTHIRLWLRAGGPIEFRWFNPIETGGFPSGHMVVFTAFFTAVWLYYPKYRALAVAALSALAAALLVTSFHFVSDIIAGISFGVLITVAIDRVLHKHFQTATPNN